MALSLFPNMSNLDLLSCIISPGTVTVSASGASVAWGTGIDISSGGLSSIDHVMYTPQFSNQEVSASDLFYENHVNTKAGFTLDVGEIRSSVAYATGFATGFNSAIEALMANYGYFKIVATTRARGTSLASTLHGVVGLVVPGQIPIVGSGTDSRKVVSFTGLPTGYAPYIGPGPLPSYFS